MKLYLVQHGEAHPKEADPDRSLTEQGAGDAQRVAAFLERAGVRVERVVHSGKRRAVQTAEHLARALAPGVAPETVRGLAPKDDPAAFDPASWDQDTLVVGHLPFLAKLVSLLVTGNTALDTVAFRPGSVVCLERGDGGAWQIAWMLRPELLR